MAHDFYNDNPMIHRDRRLSQSESYWARSFQCEDLSPLIVCRGPIRKEAMDVFAEMGMTHYGILLSEKDSITYTQALAPELRSLTDNSRVHRVPDYSGATKDERIQRMKQIIRIAEDNGYNAIFAGYGFMAEDEDFVAAVEAAGLTFVGPCARTVRGAGRKDEAKRTAEAVNVTVTPGVNDVSARALLGKYPTRASLLNLCEEKALALDETWLNQDRPLLDLADAVLNASYVKGLDLITIEELGQEIRRQVLAMYQANPSIRIRLKAIGGGGGKGQRILSAPNHKDEDLHSACEEAASRAPELLREILNEVKANAVGDNKNVLIERNIELTRHNEIQVLGNGEWCITMGGRDCSLQMHEQKLVEVSITQEGLNEAVARAEAGGRPVEAAALAQDLAILKRMEEEAARFGLAVGLDSASTFECIVDRDSHFFMEMNTRIQVEHRVSELCYKLRFHNPDDVNDYFEVDSLVEAMALLARHKKRLPKPTRIPRERAAVESRLNATDRSLSPHAGGMVRRWSDPLPFEIRDDQGISMKNPDTGLFMAYRIAGAYDSNIALLVTYGQHREDSYRRLAEILRLAKLRGTDLCTNLEFHYGIVNWFLGQNVHAKVTTRFMLPYLTMVGLLKQEINELDFGYAFDHLQSRYLRRLKSSAPEGQRDALLAATADVLECKQTLLLRPLKKMTDEPHYLSGWLSLNRGNFRIADNGRVHWLRNPVKILNDLYHYLNMDYRQDMPAATVIWDHDDQILQDALSFYRTLEQHFSMEKVPQPFVGLCEQLNQEQAPQGFDGRLWDQIRAAHKGFQTGLEMLDLLPLIGEKVGFSDLCVEDDLSVTIPERLFDAGLQERMRRVLVPPPVNRADEIVSVSGGMYYAQEGPGMPHFVHEGMHFDKGDPLYIIEVMKMFNKVYAPFAGTIDKILVESGEGLIVQKGQPLFKVTPDEKHVEIDPVAEAKRRQINTQTYLDLM